MGTDLTLLYQVQQLFFKKLQVESKFSFLNVLIDNGCKGIIILLISKIINGSFESKMNEMLEYRLSELDLCCAI